MRLIVLLALILPFAAVVTAQPRKVIFDTDFLMPPQDDGMALMLALASPELEVLGITCVAGNVPLDLTARNARVVCELAGRPDMPVFAGCAAPMTRTLVTAEHVHGKTGLDGIDLPDPSMPLQEMHAVDALDPGGTVTDVFDHAAVAVDLNEIADPHRAVE